MKPTQAQIDKVVAECREPCVVNVGGYAFEARGYFEGVIVSLADDLETSRAEHAAALGLATARIRELEGERDELLGLARDVASDAPADFADCAMLLEVGSGDERCIVERGLRARAIVARIEKAAKGAR